MQLPLKFSNFMYGCGQEHMYMYVSLDMSGLEALRLVDRVSCPTGDPSPHVVMH